MTAKCPFCQIVREDELGTREVYRNADVIAFFPSEPATLGHTLIVPRAHVAHLWDLDDATANGLTRAAITVAKALKLAVKPEGLNLIQSNGEAATQTVEHLHLHVVPRWHTDDMGRIWPTETHFSEFQKDEVLAVLQAAIRSISE